MKQDLYDTLKVPKNASPEVIKKAFRRRAKRTHPDMGGTAEEFNDVKTAYLVLINDETRKEYDETGQYSQTKADNLEAKARQTAITVFVKIVQDSGNKIFHIDIFEEMKRRISIIEQSIKNEIQEARNYAEKWTSILERLSYIGSKDNFLIPVIENQIGQANRKIINLEKELEMGRIIRDLIKGYVFKFDPNFAPSSMEVRSFTFFTNSSSTS